MFEHKATSFIHVYSLVTSVASDCKQKRSLLRVIVAFNQKHLQSDGKGEKLREKKEEYFLVLAFTVLVDVLEIRSESC